MDLNLPLLRVPGVGSIYAQRLKRLNIFTVEDLINHYPFRYDDFSKITSANEAKIGDILTLQGEIWSIKNTYTRYGKVLTQAVFNDGTTSLNLTWFSSPWLTKQIEVGDKLQVSGKLNKYKSKLSIVAPQWEKLSRSTQDTSSVSTYPTVDVSIHTGRLVPVYPETYGITSKWLRTKIDKLLPLALSQIEDFLPDDIGERMLPLPQALQMIHFPKNREDAKKAKERLSFDELFFIQLATLKVRMEWQERKVVRIFKIDRQKLDSFIANLPFKLTRAQLKVIEEIITDLKMGQPMNRLLQGEVGSGKTVVATLVMYLTHLNGLTSLLMAPTEILAWQHYDTVKKLLEPFGIKVGIYTGSRKFTENLESRIMNKAFKKHNSLFLSINSNPDVIIGTHALLSDKLTTTDVGLVIVDEQQRFGVEQRSLLRLRAKVPHFLTMTATPIPRTVALTLYGDLDLSIIDELPMGKRSVKTYVVPAHKREDAYKFITKKVLEGDQVFVITPLIEESETLQSVKAAKKEYQRLQKEVFPGLKLGLLHGKLKSQEKEQVIKKFREGQIDILVSTSVVEVGMDIPNATIMVVEGAERFGLAQLHQLRGRVGRRKKAGFCLLFLSLEEKDSIYRLKNLEKFDDGLKLAEIDLKLRGAGEIYGIRQSGRFNLKIAELFDLPLIEKARGAAQKIIRDNPKLDKYPQLQSKLQSLIANVAPD